MVWAPLIKNPGYAYAWGKGGGISSCVPQARVNFSISTKGPANFFPKTGHHKRFFMKQQDRCRKCETNPFYETARDSRIGLTGVIPDYENFGLPRVIPDMKVKLQLLFLCITYIILDYYFGS